MRNSMCTEVHGRERTDRTEIPGTTSTDDEPASSGPVRRALIGARETQLEMYDMGGLDQQGYKGEHCMVYIER